MGPAASLPPRADDEAIAAARGHAATSPTSSSLLQRIPHDLASIPGEAGQMLRRVMLHGASIVFFTPGYQGKRFIYERARELRVRVVIIDEPGSWAEETRERTAIRSTLRLTLKWTRGIRSLFLMLRMGSLS